MGYERRVMRTILSALIVLASLVTVYGDRDNNFMQQKFRNRVTSPLIQKWRESQIEGPAGEAANQQWREDLLSNLRNALRKHITSPSSSRREGIEINPYGLQETVAIPAEVPADQLFILDGPSSAMENYGSGAMGGVKREEKRNGFFFGKRNGFFFGKRSGNPEAATKTEDDRLSLPKYDATTFDECRRCGPAGQGRCVMVGTCCSPRFGCYTFTPEAAACMTEDLIPCQLEAPTCGRGGQCVANGICCSAADGACHLEPACTSMSLK